MAGNYIFINPLLKLRVAKIKHVNTLGKQNGNYVYTILRNYLALWTRIKFFLAWASILKIFISGIHGTRNYFKNTFLFCLFSIRKTKLLVLEIKIKNG